MAGTGRTVMGNLTARTALYNSRNPHVPPLVVTEHCGDGEVVLPRFKARLWAMIGVSPKQVDNRSGENG